MRRVFALFDNACGSNAILSPASFDGIQGTTTEQANYARGTNWRLAW